jgi:hypothetical protein
MKDKLYAASKTEHAAMWRDLRDNHGWPIISTWLNDAMGEDAEKNYRAMWLRFVADVHACTALVLYFCKDDRPLKGGLVEVGMVLALGKKVYVVIDDTQLGDSAAKLLGSWVWHPNVIQCVDFNHVRLEIGL